MDELAAGLERGLVRSAQLRALRGADALVRLFPVLARGSLRGTGKAQGDDDDARLRARAFAALAELLGELGRARPLVLFVDDLQWLDEDSLSFFETLLGARRKLWVLGTYRSEEKGKSRTLSRLLALAERQAALHELELGPLPEGEARALAQAWLGSAKLEPAQADSLVREAQGVPFFVTELARHAHETGHGSEAKQVVLARTELLPEGARRLLQVLSVAPRPLELTLACNAAEAQAGDAGAFYFGQHRIDLCRCQAGRQYAVDMPVFGQRPGAELAIAATHGDNG